MRSFLAILAGFVSVPIMGNILGLIMQLCGVSSFYRGNSFSPEGAVISLLCAQISNVIAGYVTGRIAQHRRLLHTLILGVIGIAMTTLVAISLWEREPVWYHWATILLVLPVTASGGWLAQRQTSSYAAQ